MVVATLLALALVVEAPPQLESAAARIHAIDQADLAAALAGAGLEPPASVHITLIPEDDPRARAAPHWIVGRAYGLSNVIIFPARVTRYPYDSLEAVTRHEVVHLALNARAAGRPLPRWFHEGVATAVESGWRVADQVRLLVAAVTDPSIDDVGELFRSASQPETTLAYLLATALVDDLRERHGPAVPGRIATRVGEGVPFERAFESETGETLQAAVAHAWSGYRRWTTWIPALTSLTSLWNLILVLAIVAFIVQTRRRARRRREWDEAD